MHDQGTENEATLRSIFLQLCSQPASVIESETLEIKSWCTGEKQLAEKASDSSACLANARGGIVLLGIEDGDVGMRKFSHCPHGNAIPEWVSQRIQDATVPPVEIRVIDASSLLREATGLPNVNCIAIFVAKSRRVGGHQTIGGVSRIRNGKDCRTSSNDQERFIFTPESQLSHTQTLPQRNSARRSGRMPPKPRSERSITFSTTTSSNRTCTSFGTTTDGRL